MQFCVAGRTCKALMGDAKRADFAKLWDLGKSEGEPSDPRVLDIIFRLDVILSVISSKSLIDTETVKTKIKSSCYCGSNSALA